MGHEAWVLAPEMPDADPREEWVVRVPSVAYPFFEDQRLAMPSSRGGLSFPFGYASEPATWPRPGVVGLTARTTHSLLLVSG
jgi:hypothetical protein